ncbi:hypothetical protein [Paracoccus albus]|uniref:hypothetical protein n=1 Tax=Paracoccus albus TaxID=3017784 RepID=UPI003EBBEBBE
MTRFIEEHLPNLAAQSASDQKSMLEQSVLPVWRNRLVSDITPTDVDALLRSVAQGRARTRKTPRKCEAGSRPTPARANRCGELLHKMSNLAIKWKMSTEYPRRIPSHDRRPNATVSCRPRSCRRWPQRCRQPRTGTALPSCACRCRHLPRSLRERPCLSGR